MPARELSAGPPAAPATGLDFELPPHLEAREPAEARGLPRDGVKLLVSYRKKDGLVHATFADLAAFLDAGDVLVVNDSATIPAALTASAPDGSAIPLHLSMHIGDDTWVVEPRAPTPETAGAPGAGPHDSTRPGPSGAGPRDLTLPGGGVAHLLAPYRASRRLWIADLDLPQPALDYLATWGRPIRYPYVRREWPLSAYQTVFATHPGSAEMPSAGRAFTPAVLASLERRGVIVKPITLHTGVASAERDEPPYDEPFVVPAATAAAVNRARAAGHRVVATGTTAVRALESAADETGHVSATEGWTDLVVTPGRRMRVVDGLLTGFHEPRASHLQMLEALAGRAHLRRAYRAALDRGYLWHEFGDLHLIL